jgi:hypothetical protein
MTSGAAEEHFCLIPGAPRGSCVIVHGAAMTNSMPPSLAKRCKAMLSSG